MICQILNSGQVHARKMPYVLYVVLLQTLDLFSIKKLNFWWELSQSQLHFYEVSLDNTWGNYIFLGIEPKPPLCKSLHSSPLSVSLICYVNILFSASLQYLGTLWFSGIQKGKTLS